MILAAVITVPLVLHFTQHSKQMTLSNQTTTQQNTSNILSEIHGALDNAANNTVTSMANNSIITTAGMTNATTKTTGGVVNTATIVTAIAQNTTTTVPTTRVTSSMVKTQYSSALTVNSQIYCRESPCSIPDTYFQAIQLNVSMSGNYTFLSNSSMDTYGFLYYNTFDPNNSTANQITYDDDDGGAHQFKFTAYLQTLTRYILVATTYATNTIGPFTITATGVAPISFSSINVSSSSSFVLSQYSSALNSSSATYCRTGNCSSSEYYYFSAFLINVNTSGYYTIGSQSNMDTYGYIYSISFNASVPLQNMMAYSDDDGGNRQFSLYLFIDTTIKYILIATTYASDTVGAFSIISYGPGSVQFIIQQ
ncbi:unnamed protein product [Adineta steineri]|uniref:Uncharacterized protein n=1 Tax=Adineta steineri TaxID=433720 RepID=A0A815GE93_9BILA|nr:unnamed protein product [Adineta steineri]